MPTLALNVGQKLLNILAELNYEQPKQECSKESSTTSSFHPLDPLSTFHLLAPYHISFSPVNLTTRSSGTPS